MSFGSQFFFCIALLTFARLTFTLSFALLALLCIAGQRVRYQKRLSFTRTCRFRFREATRRWSRFYAFSTSSVGRCRGERRASESMTPCPRFSHGTLSVSGQSPTCFANRISGKLRRKRAAAGCESRKIMAHLSENPSEGIPTRVRKTTVRTTPVRSQQCECQQCERVNSANANSANATAVRMSAVRMRQQCERRFSELCKTYRSLSLFFFLQKLLLLFTSIFYLKMPITARFSIY